MANERTIEAAAKYAIEKNARSIDLVVGYLNEASVLILVFGILDTYSTGKLNWTVGYVVVGLAFGCFVAALATRWMIYKVLKIVIRFSMSTLEQHEHASWRR